MIFSCFLASISKFSGFPWVNSETVISYPNKVENPSFPWVVGVGWSQVILKRINRDPGCFMFSIFHCFIPSSKDLVCKSSNMVFF